MFTVTPKVVNNSGISRRNAELLNDFFNDQNEDNDQSRLYHLLLVPFLCLIFDDLAFYMYKYDSKGEIKITTKTWTKKIGTRLNVVTKLFDDTELPPKREWNSACSICIGFNEVTMEYCHVSFL